VVCAAVNTLLVPPDTAADVMRLVPDSAPGRDWFATIAVWNQPGRFLRFTMGVDVQTLIHVPFALFFALVVATWWVWGRDRFPIRRLLLGGAGLIGQAGFRFVLLGRQADGLLHRGPVDLLLQTINQVLAAPTMIYVAPLVLWWLLLRREDGCATAPTRAHAAT
jgi:hypothetical protein